MLVFQDLEQVVCRFHGNYVSFGVSVLSKLKVFFFTRLALSFITTICFAQFLPSLLQI